MANQEIALAVSATWFGIFIGFLAGYAARAYISYLRRRSRQRRGGRGETEGENRHNKGRTRDAGTQSL